jgi:hypothetical protein
MNQRVKEKNKWIDRLINFVLWLCTCSDMVAVTNHDLFFVQDSYCIHASYSDKR